MGHVSDGRKVLDGAVRCRGFSPASKSGRKVRKEGPEGEDGWRRAHAATIYVLDQPSSVSSHPDVQAAKTHLTTLGHAVTSGGALADYSAFDQVWDPRFNQALVAADIAAMGTYLAGGGRMYLTGEFGNFDLARNNSLILFLDAVGAGPVSGAAPAVAEVAGPQSITAAGQSVNFPNTLSSVRFDAARTVTEASPGFLVTETSAGSGHGSLVGWDFGDIVGKPEARMLVGFDIDVFGVQTHPSFSHIVLWTEQNARDWTENMATFLGARAPAVSEPASVVLWGIGLAGLALAAARRRRE